MAERRNGNGRLQTWSFAAVAIVAVLGVVAVSAKAFQRIDDHERRITRNEKDHDLLIRIETKVGAIETAVSEIKRLAEKQ